VLNSARRILGAALAVGTAPALGAQAAPHTVPGVSFHISSSTRISATENAGGQDDQMVRGRGVAANGRARIELLAAVPLPNGLTLDDQLLALDSGRVVAIRANGSSLPMNDQFGGPGILALARSGGGG